MTTQQRTPASPSSDDRNSFLDGGDNVSVRESACKSLRILLPILALYTLFSLAWTTPITSVLHTVSSGNTIKHRRPTQYDTTTTTTITTTDNQPVIDNNPPTTTDTTTEINTEQQQQRQVEHQQPKPVVEEQVKQDQPPAQPPVQPPSFQPPPVQPLTTTTTKDEKPIQPTTDTTTQTSTVEKQQRDNTNQGTDTTSTGVGNLQVDEGPLVRPASERRKTYKMDLPECMQGGKKAKTFLMVFMGHSGSTAIMSELKSHPEIHFEQFEPVDHDEIQQNTTMALQYTRDFFNRGIQLGKVPGFKIRPLHIRNDPKGWAKLAREFDTRIIWQYRRNSLKQSVGEYSYRVLKDNSILEGLRSEDEVKKRCDIGAGCSFAIDDFKVFHQILTSVTKSDFLIADAAHLIADGRDCVHEMRYEDYLYHRKGSMLDLLQFLGVSQIETEPNRYKATRDNLCEVVLNWNDLCNAFYGCKVWRPLFEDGENGCSCKFSSSPVEFCTTPKLG